MRILPETLRDVLNQPVGKLLNESELVSYLKDEPLVISIGDRVTYTLLHHNIHPKIAIVDYICERKTYEEDKKTLIQNYGNLVLEAKNPPGHLTENLWETIQQALNRIDEGPIRIDVDKMPPDLVSGASSRSGTIFPDQPVGDWGYRSRYTIRSTGSILAFMGCTISFRIVMVAGVFCLGGVENGFPPL